MASSTIEPAAHGAKPRRVKESSGFSFRSLFTRTVDDDEEPEPFAPDAQSRWVLEHVKQDLRGELSKAVDYLVAKQQKPPVAASPTDLDGSRPAYLLRRLALLALDLEIDPELTFTQAVERLQWAWNMLLERAAAQEAFERHTLTNKAEAEAEGALLFAAGRRGTPIGKGSERGQVTVAEVVDRARNAPVPTGRLPLMTDEVLARIDNGEDPEAVAASITATAVLPSPIREDTPPIPAEDDEDADPGAHKPLPRRIPYGTSGQVVEHAAETEATK